MEVDTTQSSLRAITAEPSNAAVLWGVLGPERSRCGDRARATALRFCGVGSSLRERVVEVDLTLIGRGAMEFCSVPGELGRDHLSSGNLVVRRVTLSTDQRE